MATHIQQWRLTNKKESLTFGSVEEFFNKSSSAGLSEETIQAHINNESLYVLFKKAYLGDDNKSVVIVKEFKDEASFKEWEEKAKALPPIDELLNAEAGTFLADEELV